MNYAEEKFDQHLLREFFIQKTSTLDTLVIFQTDEWVPFYFNFLDRVENLGESM